MSENALSPSGASTLPAEKADARATDAVRPDDPRIAALGGGDPAAVRDALKSLVEAGTLSVAALVPVMDKEAGDLGRNAREALLQIAARAWAVGHQKQVSLALVEQMQPGYSIETRRWICRMLAVVGDAECVDPLYRWLADEQIGEDVRRAMIAIPSRNTLEALVGGLQLVVGDPLLAILDALGEKAERDVVPVLRVGAESGEDPIRTRAREALARIADPAALATIQKAFEAREPGAARALLTVGETLADSGAEADALVAFRTVGSFGAATAIEYCHALHGLGRLGGAEDAKFVLENLANAARWGKFKARIQAASYDALASMPGKGVTETVTEAVARLDGQPKQALQRVLARRQAGLDIGFVRETGTTIPASKPGSF
ncbi:MAG TPA: hypothetical protein PKY77_01130 [Phycisphaerae bacterium]|nr:hypothetical protein [Phycisphaerae bacterium]HRY67541.1 hypothetical protein [Phycisphaerae bacterium]HSA24928.1 hypothetical protein [Phycisphaerae bacterium]